MIFDVQPVTIVRARKILVGTAKSVQTVFEVIYEANNSLCLVDIMNQSGYCVRTVRDALNLLCRMKFVIKTANPDDLRSYFFLLSPELVKLDKLP